MTERERLTELICKGIEYARWQMNDEGVDFAYRDVADYLLANGVIVPPCKVGDTVYAFCEELGGVFPYFVEDLNIGFMDKDKNYLTYEANCHDEETDEFLDEIDFDLDDIGKTVFLTKEEAEKALKERSERDES